MPTREIQHRKDSQLFAQLCLALLREGHSVQFRVQGESMRPNILDGDAVLVAPVAEGELRQGDIALVQNQDGFRVHRVASRDASSGAVFTRSDTGLGSDPFASRLFGKVIVLRRNSRKESLTPLQTRVVHPLRVMVHRMRTAARLRLRRAALLLSGIVALSLLYATFLVPAAHAQNADLAVTVDTAAPATVLPGAQITYTITVINNGPAAATRPVFTMATPASTTFVSAAQSGGAGTWPCVNPPVGGTGTSTCTRSANMPSTSTTTFTVVVQVNAGTANGTIITNSANITSTTNDPTPANNTLSVSVTVQIADLSMTQAAAPNPVAPATNITYTETVTNNSLVAAAGATLTQTTPANTTFVSATPPANWTCAVPAVGGTGTIICAATAAMAASTTTGNFTIVVKVNSGVSSGSTITNTATVSETLTDPVPGNNTTSTSVTVQPADLQLTQTVSPSDVAPGASYVYTESVTNNGPTDVATGTITVSTQTPANTNYQSFAGTNWTCATHPVAGGTGNIVCTYNAALANGTAANALTITMQVNTGTASGTNIPNSATVADSAFVDPIPANNTSTASIIVEAAGTADLQLTQTPSAPAVAAGATYTYTQTVTDNGPAGVATGTITVYMQTPANTNYQAFAGTSWACGTHPAVGAAGPIVCTYNAALASGATANVLTISLQVNAGTATGTTIQSSATVTNSTIVDPIPSNNTSITSIVVEPANTPDLGVSMSVSPTPVFVSSNITYTIQVQNIGTAAATSAATTLTITLPSGLTNISFAFSPLPSVWNCGTPASTTTCTLPGSIAVGATETITIAATAPSAPTTLNATAKLTLAGDLNGSNDNASAYTVVQPLVCATPGRDGAGGTLTGIVNTYFPPSTAGTLGAGSTSVVLGAASGAATPIAAGDLLLIIQMQGAGINSTNTGAYGDGLAGDPASGSTNLGSSGLFEFVTATNAVGTAGGMLQFAGTGSGGLLNSYSHVVATLTQAQQTYQVIRVPQYTSATLSSGLVPLVWNGSVGGVLVLDVSSQLTLGGTVALDALGFRGGGGQQLAGAAGAVTDYVTAAPANNTTTAGTNGSKGEGIAGTPRYVAPATITPTGVVPLDTTGGNPADSLPGGSYARGAPGNAGGGGTDGHPSGNDYNSGGGAGGNGGTGGQGGYGWDSLTVTDSTDGGFGGVAFPASTSALVMGGGGGAGTTNNGTYFISTTNNGDRQRHLQQRWRRWRHRHHPRRQCFRHRQHYFQRPIHSQHEQRRHGRCRGWRLRSVFRQQC